MATGLFTNDIGYFDDKVNVDGKTFMIKSIVGTGRTLKLNDLNLSLKSDNEDNIICHMDDETYFVSDLAVAQSEILYHTLKPNRFDSVSAKVLAHTAFAIGLGKGYHETYMVSGLPISHYSQFKGDISTLFASNNFVHEYNVEVNGNVIKGSVRIIENRFIPQPFAVLMNEILDEKGTVSNTELARKTVAVIDIGFGTTDVYVANALTPIEKYTFSSQTAMNTVCQLIADKLLEKDIELPLHAIEPSLKTGNVKYKNKSYDVRGIVQWACQSTTDTLISELYKKWKNPNFVDQVIIGGGGGICLRKYIGNEFGSPIMARDGQYSVVNGYAKWGRRTWKGLS